MRPAPIHRQALGATLRPAPGARATLPAEFSDTTNRGNWAACESVSRGLGSRGARQGPFARNEDEVHMFMAMVAGGYVDGRVVPRSAP